MITKLTNTSEYDRNSNSSDVCVGGMEGRGGLSSVQNQYIKYFMNDSNYRGHSDLIYIYLKKEPIWTHLEQGLPKISSNSTHSKPSTKNEIFNLHPSVGKAVQLLNEF